MFQKLISFTLLLALIQPLFSQTNVKEPFPYSNRFSLLGGLIQPLLLKGGNVEVNYFSKRISFDYSHGFLLQVPASKTYADQGICSFLPFSTGFGIGYRFLPFLDLRVEPKLHSWEVYYANENRRDVTPIASYKTFTIGLGLYYRYMPFKNSKSMFLQGLTTSTSVRWWPNIGSTLSNDEFSYVNKFSQQTETLKAANVGMANTPFIFNIGVGFTFGGR